MKNIDNEIKREARKLYYNYLVRNIRNIYNRPVGLPRLDMRYNRNRAIMAEFVKMMQSTNFTTLWLKGHDKFMSRLVSGRKSRIYANVLQNPIVIDYYNNRHLIKCIYSDHLYFGSRNHWAKDDNDKKILSILAKNFKKYKELQK